MLYTLTPEAFMTPPGPLVTVVIPASVMFVLWVFPPFSGSGPGMSFLPLPLLEYRE